MMTKICRGKDVRITIPLLTDGQERDIGERDIRVQIIYPNGEKIFHEFSTNDNAITFVFAGTEQTIYGSYSLRIWENYDKNGQCLVDANDAFALVISTDDESSTPSTDSNIEITPVADISIEPVAKAYYDGEGVVITNNKILKDIRYE